MHHWNKVIDSHNKSFNSNYLVVNIGTKRIAFHHLSPFFIVDNQFTMF